MLFAWRQATAQVDRIEEIKEYLKNAAISSHDSLYYELFKAYRSNDIYLAKRYAQLAKKNAEIYNNNSIELKAINALAYIYEQTNVLDSAIITYKLGITQSKKYNNATRLIYFSNDLGNLYENLDIYDSALYYYQESFEYSTSAGSSYDQAIALNNSGLIFYRLDNAQEAISYFEEALKIKKAENIKEGIDLNLINIAMCNNELGNYEKAIDAVTELIDMCKDSNTNCSEHIKQDANYQLGLSYEYLRSPQQAISFFKKSIDEAPNNPSPQTFGGALYHLAFLYFESNPELSLSYLQQAESFSLKQNRKRLLKDIYGLYAKHYEKNGKLQLSMEYLSKYNILKDSIFNEKMSNNMRNLQLAAQKKKNDEVFRKQQLLIERSNQITKLTAVIAALAFLVALLLFSLFRTIKNRNKVLKKEVDKKTELILQTSNDLKRTNERLKKSQSEYQHLIYRSSHDLKGPITTLLGLINLAKTDTNTSKNWVGEYLSGMESTALKLDNLLSRLVYISNVTEDPINITQINIKNIVSEIIDKHAIGFPNTIIDNKISTNIFISSDKRLFTLAMDFIIENAFKYSSSVGQDKHPQVTFACDVTETNISIQVSDNGDGIAETLKDKLFELFIVGEGHRGPGIGLYVAKKALERIAGKVRISSTSNPTTFNIELPFTITP